MNKLTINRMNNIATYSDLQSYIETALWSSSDTFEGEDVCLDNGEFELSEAARLEMNVDITAFWDGDYPECGDKLCAISKKFGECNLYISDDKNIRIE